MISESVSQNSERVRCGCGILDYYKKRDYDASTYLFHHSTPREEDAAMNRFRLMLAIIASGILIAGYLILSKESKGQEVSDPCNRQVLQRDVRMFKEEKDAIQARLKDVMDEGELVSAQIISLGQMVAEPKEFCQVNPRSCVMAAQLARGFALLNGEAATLHERIQNLERRMQDRM